PADSIAARFRRGFPVECHGAMKQLRFDAMAGTAMSRPIIPRFGEIMKEKFVRLLALGGALCMPLGIQAASGSATIQSVQFELIDLAPDDGVAPSLVWDAALASADASSAFGSALSFGPDGTWTVSFVNSSSDSVFDPASFLSAATASFAGASASFGGSGFPIQFQPHHHG